MQVFNTADEVSGEAGQFRVHSAPATVAIGGLGVGEQVEIRIWNGLEYSTLIDWTSGDPVIFTADKPHGLLEGCGLYEAYKDATGNPVSMIVTPNG